MAKIEFTQSIKLYYVFMVDLATKWKEYWHEKRLKHVVLHSTYKNNQSRMKYSRHVVGCDLTY